VTVHPKLDVSDQACSEPTSPPVAPQRNWKKRAAFAGGVLFVAVASYFLIQRRSEAASGTTTARAPDVPRVEGDHIRFSDGFARRVGIRMQRVRVEQLVPVVQAVGTVDFNAEHVVAVGARLRGLISRVRRFEGDAVKDGDPLARVESAELGEAQARVSMLDAEREAAQLNAKREETLAARNLTTAREAEMASVAARKSTLLLAAAKQNVAALGGSARASEQSLGSHELRSPIEGTVVERNVAPGQFIEGQLVAFKVANLDHLWIELDVFERNLYRIQVGDHAEIKPLSGDAGTLEGKVAKVASNIDQETHSAKVRIEVENRDRRLRVGQAVKATIHCNGGKLAPRPLIPTRAITFVDGKPRVFVAVGPHAVRVTRVVLGANDGDETEIIEGVGEADEVVTNGAFALKSELFR
jgi:cobalt-zinc-cadmium efflux system membrane fusion protein